MITPFMATRDQEMDREWGREDNTLLDRPARYRARGPCGPRRTPPGLCCTCCLPPLLEAKAIPAVTHGAGQLPLPALPEQPALELWPLPILSTLCQLPLLQASGGCLHPSACSPRISPGEQRGHLCCRIRGLGSVQIGMLCLPLGQHHG